LRARWEAVRHPSRDGAKRPEGLDGHPGFEPLDVREVPFVDHTDRERIVAHWNSMSAIASLDPAERTRVLGDIDAILERHGVQTVDRPYCAELWITRRRPGRAPRAGRRAAAS
jgi:hypothetical protein